jgi:PAS domain S-box-containing protein
MASPENFRAVVEGLAEGVLLTDLDDRVLYVNPRMCALTGFSEADYLGRPAYELLLPREQWPTLLGRLERRSAGEAETYEVDLLRKDGSAFRARVTASPFRDPSDGRIIGTLGATTDITQEYHAAAALRASEERFRVVAENVSEVITVLSPAGIVRFENGALARVLGYAPEELVGDTGFGRVHPDDLPRVEAAFAACLKRERGGRGGRVEFRARHRDGSWRWLEASDVNLVGVPGIDGVLVVSRDITERKRAEEARAALEQERAEARRRERAMLRDVLFAVTDGALRLCDTEADLPEPLPPPPGEDESPERLPWVELRDAAALAEVRRRVRAAGESAGFAPDRWHGLMAAASEAAMNALVHGEGRAGARVGVATDGSVLQVWVADRGEGIPVEELPRATLLRGHSGAGTLGQGFSLMLGLCDRVHLLTGADGTTVVLEQRRETPDDARARF